MVLDALPHPTRSSITTFRTFLLVIILAVGCALSSNSLLFAAELFPYAPPSALNNVQSNNNLHQYLSFPLKIKQGSGRSTSSGISGKATFAKDLRETFKGNFDQTVFPTRKLDGEGKF